MVVRRNHFNLLSPVGKRLSVGWRKSRKKSSSFCIFSLLSTLRYMCCAHIFIALSPLIYIPWWAESTSVCSRVTSLLEKLLWPHLLPYGGQRLGCLLWQPLGVLQIQGVLTSFVVVVFKKKLKLVTTKSHMNTKFISRWECFSLFLPLSALLPWSHALVSSTRQPSCFSCGFPTWESAQELPF